MSGALITPVICYLLDKHPVLVRRGEDCHSDYSVEGETFFNSFIVIDDLISTGKTMRIILSEIEKHSKRDGQKPPICKGIILYNESCGYKSYFEYSNLENKELIPVFGV
ncbi:MAG: hypothetical protein AABY22_09215 [Nanoarchaeota archaeon]